MERCSRIQLVDVYRCEGGVTKRVTALEGDGIREVEGHNRYGLSYEIIVIIINIGRNKYPVIGNTRCYQWDVVLLLRMAPDTTSQLLQQD